MFKWGDFISHSGKTLPWKIECDDLTEEDIDCIARIIAKNLSFRKVYGIPRGGDRIARALQKYCSDDDNDTLIVDDVYTTGKSMIEKKDELVKKGESHIYGVVLFARGKTPWWVLSIFETSWK